MSKSTSKNNVLKGVKKAAKEAANLTKKDEQAQDRKTKEEMTRINREKWLSGLRPQAEALLSDPNMVTRIRDSFKTVNEQDSELYALHAIMQKQSVEIRGSSSTGKNTIADEVCEYLPPGWAKKITGLTDKAIRYLPAGLRVLYLAERRGMESGDADKESTSMYDVKLAISEGKITILVTEKDPETNQFVTNEREVKIDSFLITSTSEQVQPEYDNRLHLLDARDDREQNQLVVHEILKQEKTLPSNRKNNDDFKKVAQAALEIVDIEAPDKVLIAFADLMEDCFDYNKSFVRRNIKKLLAVIHASARLHFKQRPIISDEGKKIIIAVPADLQSVLIFGERALTSTFTILTEPQMETLQACKNLYDRNDEITTKSVFAELQKISKRENKENTVYRRLKSIAFKGYLVPDEKQLVDEKGHANGRPLKIYVLAPLEGRAPALSALIEEDRLQKYEEATKALLAQNGSLAVAVTGGFRMTTPKNEETNFPNSSNTASLGEQGSNQTISKSELREKSPHHPKTPPTVNAEPISESSAINEVSKISLETKKDAMQGHCEDCNLDFADIDLWADHLKKIHGADF
ncbi:MAG: hypothetical protein ACYC9R_12165 [Nitrosotalea sp.]